MSLYSSIVAPDSGTLPSQTAETIRTIERLRRTNPAAAALKATKNIEAVSPQLAADLLRDLLRTVRPYSKVAETLATRAIQGRMTRRARLALASHARAKGLARVATILIGQTDN